MLLLLSSQTNVIVFQIQLYTIMHCVANGSPGALVVVDGAARFRRTCLRLSDSNTRPDSPNNTSPVSRFFLELPSKVFFKSSFSAIIDFLTGLPLQRVIVGKTNLLLLSMVTLTSTSQLPNFTAKSVKLYTKAPRQVKDANVHHVLLITPGRIQYMYVHSNIGFYFYFIYYSLYVDDLYLPCFEYINIEQHTATTVNFHDHV